MHSDVRDDDFVEMAGSPFQDGIDHVNIFSRSQCELGRLLSNFTKSPFVHPVYGAFQSMEGFYYYISTGMVCEELKNKYGADAKTLGRKFEKVLVNNFNDIMMEGLRCKLQQNPLIKSRLVNTNLPFKHYYYFGKLEPNKPYRIHVPAGAKWWCDAWTKLRNELFEEEQAVRSVSRS